MGRHVAEYDSLGRAFDNATNPRPLVIAMPLLGSLTLPGVPVTKQRRAKRSSPITPTTAAGRAHTRPAASDFYRLSN